MEILMVGPNDQHTELYWIDVWSNEEDNVEVPLQDSGILAALDSEVCHIDSRNLVSDVKAENIVAENIAKEQHDDEHLALLIACKQKGFSVC